MVRSHPVRARRAARRGLQLAADFVRVQAAPSGASVANAGGALRWRTDWCSMLTVGDDSAQESVLKWS